MTSVSVIVADAALRATAEKWARSGLLGDSLWLERGLLQSGMSRKDWQRVGALHLSGSPSLDVPLQRYLADLDDLERVTVAWVRPDAGSAEDFTGMASLAEFLRGLINEAISTWSLDVLVPTSLDEIQTPNAPPGWHQVVVAPEDHKDLGAADAGWVDREQAVTLHALAALVGRLGGEHAPPPPPSTPGVSIVSCVSRHVLGAEQARSRAAVYLDRDLPASDATDVAPLRHVLLHDQWDEVDRAVEFLDSVADDSLRHLPHPPVDPRKASPWSGLEEPEAFRTRPWRRALSEFISGTDPYEELAAQPDPQEDDDKPLPPPLHPQVWERRALPVFRRELRRAAESSGSIPPPIVWRTLVDLCTSMVDGGQLPHEYPPVIVHTRRGVIEPTYAGPDPGLVSDLWSEEHEQLVPELEFGPPVPITATSIARVVQATQGTPPPIINRHEPRPIRILAKLVNDSHESGRAEQLTTLSSVTAAEPIQGKLTFFDRHFLGVLTSAIHGRLDAQLWQDLTLQDWPQPQWITGRVRAGAGMLAGLAMTGAVLWGLFHDDINSFLANWSQGPWSDQGVYGAMGALFALSLIIGYLITLKVIHERDEYWRWRMGARLQLASGALASFDDANRLRNALRISDLWRRVLLGILPLREGQQEDLGVTVSDELPVGLSWTHPNLHQPYEQIVVLGAGAKPGFRGLIVRQVTQYILSRYGDSDTHEDPMASLSNDTGYNEGPLHRAARDIFQGWDGWRHKEVSRIAAQVKEAIAVEQTPVVVDDGSDVTLAAFLAETTQEPDFQPGYGWGLPAAGGDRQSTHRWSTHPPAGHHKALAADAIYATSGALVIRHRPAWTQARKAGVGRSDSEQPEVRPDL